MSLDFIRTRGYHSIRGLPVSESSTHHLMTTNNSFADESIWDKGTWHFTEEDLEILDMGFMNLSIPKYECH